jgi:deazaflavin-dependent oxidoreductase (nitroreductase family)
VTINNVFFMTAQEYLYLTTTGRRTGLPREIEIWFTEREGRFYVIAEHREDAKWVRNIRADDAVQFRVGDQVFTGRGRVPDADTEAELIRTIQRLSEAKYGWGDGLVIELIPDGSQGSTGS